VDEVEEALEEDIPDRLLERLKVKSDYFTIISDGFIGKKPESGEPDRRTRARIRAVVRRGDDKIQIIYWRFES